MLDELHLLGSTERSIVVQTHKGNEIKNLIELSPGPREIENYRRLVEKFKGRWIERKPATGVYNCAGHVWCNRRTSVFLEMEKHAKIIFSDDGYRIVAWPKEQLHPGDLAIYWEKSRRGLDFLHIGMIVELRKGIDGDSLNEPWVLSKWNSTSGEVIHHFAHHPFYLSIPFEEQSEYQVIHEFWTDRPLSN